TAMAWSKRRPDADSSRSGLGGSTASTQAKIGSGRITMPAPPPKGESSTDRWASVACSRGSWTRRSTTPFERARPSRPSDANPSTSPGKIVNTSMRTSGPEVEEAVGGVDDDAVGVVPTGDEADRHQGAVVELQEVVGRVGHDGDHPPTDRPVDLDHLGADQLVHPEGIGVVDG